MGALKDFFSLKWLTGNTSQASVQRSSGSNSAPDTSLNTNGNRVAANRNSESIFAGETTPNKGFPNLIWAFFYLTFFSMVGIAIIGWRASLFAQGITIIATIFALILAFMFGLVVIFWNYVMVLGLWKTAELLFEMVRGGDISPTKLKGVATGTLLYVVMVIMVGCGMAATYTTMFTQDNRITLMFNQIATPQEIKQSASIGGGIAGSNSRHVVIRGETLAIIADKYNTTVDALKHTNNITSDRIDTGQILNIP